MPPTCAAEECIPQAPLSQVRLLPAKPTLTSIHTPPRDPTTASPYLSHQAPPQFAHYPSAASISAPAPGLLHASPYPSHQASQTNAHYNSLHTGARINICCACGQGYHMHEHGDTFICETCLDFIRDFQYRSDEDLYVVRLLNPLKEQGLGEVGLQEYMSKKPHIQMSSRERRGGPGVARQPARQRQESWPPQQGFAPKHVQQQQGPAATPRPMLCGEYNSAAPARYYGSQQGPISQLVRHLRPIAPASTPLVTGGYVFPLVAGAENSTSPYAMQQRRLSTPISTTSVFGGYIYSPSPGYEQWHRP